jgi:hypothetical protein
LWALLAGRAPFTEGPGPVETAVVMQRSMVGGIDRPASATPEPMVQFVRRAMAVDRAERPADAEAFLGELRRAVRLSEDAEQGSTAVGTLRPRRQSPAESADPGDGFGPVRRGGVGGGPVNAAGRFRPATVALVAMVVAGLALVGVGLWQALA